MEDAEALGEFHPALGQHRVTARLLFDDEVGKQRRTDADSTSSVSMAPTSVREVERLAPKLGTNTGRPVSRLVRGEIVETGLGAFSPTRFDARLPDWVARWFPDNPGPRDTTPE